MDPIALQGAAGLRPQTGRTEPGGEAEATGTPFSERVSTALRDTNRELQGAEQAARDVAAGRGDIVDTMIALSRAEVSLRQLVTLRNRLLESYQQIMRLQL